MIDLADLDPLRSRIGRALHVEEVAFRTVRVALHHHRAIDDVRQQHGRNVDVILNEISLGNAQLGPEELVEVSELDGAVAELEVERVLPFGKLDVRDANFAARGWG